MDIYVARRQLLNRGLVPNFRSLEEEKYFPCCCSVAKLCLILAIPQTATCQASLSFTISRSLFKFMFIESVMLFSHLVLCCPLLLWPSIFPSFGVFSNESAVRIRWPEHWIDSASASILPMNIPLGFSGLSSLQSRYNNVALANCMAFL